MMAKSTMKIVLEAIEQGHGTLHEVMEHTGLLTDAQVRSAIWNLCFIGAIQKRADSRYASIRGVACL
jgi:hypothetical protein